MFALYKGAIAGYPMMNLKIRVLNGSYINKRTSNISIEMLSN